MIQKFGSILVAHEMSNLKVKKDAQEVSAQAKNVQDSVPTNKLEESALVQETSAVVGKPEITNDDQDSIKTKLYEIGETNVENAEEAFKRYQHIQIVTMLKSLYATDDSPETKEA